MHPQPLSKQVTLNRWVLWASLLRSLTNVNDKQSQRLGLQLKTVFVGHVAPYQTQAICLINISLCVISLIPLKSLTPSTTYTCGFAPSEIGRKALLAVPPFLCMALLFFHDFHLSSILWFLILSIFGIQTAICCYGSSHDSSHSRNCNEATTEPSS